MPPFSPTFIPRIQALFGELRRLSRFSGCYFHFGEALPPLPDSGFCRFCRGCLAHARAGILCHNNAQVAAIQGFAIGDAWYCRCWLGIDCAVIPIAPENQIIGAIELGGFFSPGESQRAEQKILARLASLDGGGTTEKYISALQAMREETFMHVQAAAEFVIAATFTKGLNQADEWKLRKRIFQMQQRSRPEQADAPAGSYQDKLAALAQALEQKEPARIRLAMDEFVIHLFDSAEGDTEHFRAGLLPLLALQANRQVRGGKSLATTLRTLEKRFTEIESLDSVPRICGWLEGILQLAPATGTGGGITVAPLRQRLEDWLPKRLAEPLRVVDAARALGVSPSSLVHRLKQESGLTFGELVQTARVCEAKRLLALTSLTLSDISQRCGFHDQSYFTKVFARHIGLRPGEFRRMLVSLPTA